MYDLDLMILTDLALVLCLHLDFILSFIIYSFYNLWLSIVYSPGFEISASLHSSVFFLPIDLLYYPTGERQYKSNASALDDLLLIYL